MRLASFIALESRMALEARMAVESRIRWMRSGRFVAFWGSRLGSMRSRLS